MSEQHPEFYNCRDQYDARKYWSSVRHRIAPWLRDPRWSMDRAEADEVLRLLSLRSGPKEMRRALILVESEEERRETAHPLASVTDSGGAGIGLPEDVFIQVMVLTARSGPWTRRDALRTRCHEVMGVKDWDSRHRVEVTRIERILGSARGGRPRKRDPRDEPPNGPVPWLRLGEWRRSTSLRGEPT